MRLLVILDSEERTQALSNFLTQHGIENQAEIQVIRDWGSEEYGTFHGKIWVVEEDQLETAKELLAQFDSSRTKVEPKRQLFQEKEEVHKEEKIVPIPAKKSAPITIYLIILCCLIYFIGEVTSPHIPSSLPHLPLTPLLSSPIHNALMFDFPKAYEMVSKLVSLYGIEALEKPNELPPEGRYYMNQISNFPYWQGLYDRFISYLISPSINEPVFNAPLFEKLKEGEIWRTFTPILLHGDLFHLLFNMLWLFVLGKQMEERMGIFKYLLFILVAAVITDTAQYMMTGPNFIGFSGVLCAMFTFIWMRQQLAPWEGYQLQRATFLFILVFVFGLVALQFLSLIIELLTKQTLPIAIANTAHLLGLVVGLVLGNFRYFERKA